MIPLVPSLLTQKLRPTERQVEPWFLKLKKKNKLSPGSLPSGMALNSTHPLHVSASLSIGGDDGNTYHPGQGGNQIRLHFKAFMNS